MVKMRHLKGVSMARGSKLFEIRTAFYRKEKNTFTLVGFNAIKSKKNRLEIGQLCLLFEREAMKKKLNKFIRKKT